MKKLLFVAALGVAGMVSANTLPTPKNNSSYLGKEELPQGTCYVRVCQSQEIPNPDGSTTEVKVCSDWVQVECQPKNLTPAPSL